MGSHLKSCQPWTSKAVRVTAADLTVSAKITVTTTSLVWDSSDLEAVKTGLRDGEGGGE